MIPEDFKIRMSAMLGGQYGDFIEALETAEAVRALRVNTLKCSTESFLENAGFNTEPLAFSSEGFIFHEEKIGAHPFHHAGAFYVQDPSAMSAVCAGAQYISPGDRVLDLCAAPGGKSGQLAAILDGTGLLVSNEVVQSRCRILRGNLERLGVRNAVVMSADTSAIAEKYPSQFDFVLCDAPCSGEGMMRKYEEAVSEWSVENVKMCAERQKKILRDAAKTVAPGGYLLYSTCTFSVEENEENVSWLLDSRPDFHLVPCTDSIVKITAEGITPKDSKYDMTLTRRFYPHISQGEGQFVSIMRRNPDSAAEPMPKCRTASAEKLTRDEEKAVKAFFDEAVGAVPGELVKKRDTVFILPDKILPGLAEDSFCPGTCAGALARGRFEPHHHLFSAYGSLFIRKADFDISSPECAAYLRGETVGVENADNGWCAVTLSGCPAGGGKIVNGTLKNHYPKGLRSRG